MSAATLPDSMRAIRSAAFETETCTTRARIVRDIDCESVAPELAARMWHHVAGATILGPLCCGTPASHRDALAGIARELRGEVTTRVGNV